MRILCQDRNIQANETPHWSKRSSIIMLQICIVLHSIVKEFIGLNILMTAKVIVDIVIHSQWISLYPSHISVCELLLTSQLHRSQHVALHVYFLSDLSIDSSPSWSTLTFLVKHAYFCDIESQSSKCDTSPVAESDPLKCRVIFKTG